MPAFESRRVRTQPLTVTGMSLGASPANGGVLSTTDVLAKTGQSIDAWGAAWWQNAFVHPELLGDTTGEFGYLGNVGGPVFFAGRFIARGMR